MARSPWIAIRLRRRELREHSMVGQPEAGPPPDQTASRISSHQVRRNVHMSSRSQSGCGMVAVMRLAVIAVLCIAGTLAAAQDERVPKWELFGGYSFFHPGADVHGTLPLGLLPVSSRLESNPRGVGASLTYNFNHWFGLSLDTSTHWGSGESTLGRRIDDAAFSNLSFGPKVTFRHHYVSPFVEVLV